jgi:hypothetical protein
MHVRSCLIDYFGTRLTSRVNFNLSSELSLAYYVFLRSASMAWAANAMVMAALLCVRLSRC